MTRAFLSIKYYPDMRNRGQIEAITAALAANGIETACIVRDLEQWGAVSFSARDLMERTFEWIRDCDFLLVDISEKGVGVGIEAGYAHALGKPVWVVAREGSDIPETLRGIARKVFIYLDTAALGQLFVEVASRESDFRNR